MADDIREFHTEIKTTTEGRYYLSVEHIPTQQSAGSWLPPPDASGEWDGAYLGIVATMLRQHIRTRLEYFGEH